MLTVACALRKSRDYDVDYVEKLLAGVARNLRAPYRFVCLSDVDVPCDRIPLKHDWPGWWAKIELFNLAPPVLYFDLDTTIVGDLTEIAAHAAQTPFTTLRDFYREKGIGSGMMAWAFPLTHVYLAFAARAKEAMRETKHGDQGFLEATGYRPDKWQDVLPGQVVSYKAHVKGKGVPNGARVVCFHGKPKPRELAWTI
jgi:hypothetical protein